MVCADVGHDPGTSGTWMKSSFGSKECNYLWRAVDQDGVVLDILVQARRDAQAAKRFFKRLLAGLQYEPRVIVTDKLRSYGVARLCSNKAGQVSLGNY
jgi:transposase-like protein